MNIKIVYNSKTGNTKKIAEAMASVLNCNSENMSSFKIEEQIDILFIGAAIYATYDHNIDPLVKDFINKLDSNKVKQVVLFCTGFSDMANIKMKELLAFKNIKVSEKTFMCKGKLFFIFNYGHPNNKDIENAKNFAKNLIY